MKNWIKAVLILVISCGTVLFPKSIEARSGCCSHHGGVCGCGCCDGTPLSATCAPYYPNCGGNNSVVVKPTSVRKSTSTPKPTRVPTIKPTKRLTMVPTAIPTKKPTPTITPSATATQTISPTPTPTEIPTSTATLTPTNTPTVIPIKTEISPTIAPTITIMPTITPTPTPALTFWQKILRLFNRK